MKLQRQMSPSFPITFDFARLFVSLERCPGLQCKEWALNKSGADPGIESVLIQRRTRELVTYALVRLRLDAMPDLFALCCDAAWLHSERVRSDQEPASPALS
jgi:hypothetical protein